MHPILVVDDDLDFRTTIIDVLHKEGFPTRHAATGHEALLLINQGKYDIVLLDLVLPGIDGLETLRRIRLLDEQVKVVLITAFATIENAVGSVKMGAVDFLTKPCRIADLITLVQRLLAEVRFEQEAKELNLDPLLACLSHPIRRGIVDLLSQQPILRMTDLLRQLEITDHTKLNFHLRNLLEHGIINKVTSRGYQLTSQGQTLLSGLHAISVRLAATRIRE
ncbi:MAG: response regulator [Magnetococcus sp. XQGC-1]